ncbi:methylated-DNA--[protein]-cysteine S-methyltransferase [Vitiosangium sp. GDMCC 1.1324]|uniref:methylated-DNA--[protein]-cysteine S-methyltransferase n=1 Tax=Vitiosangium sp. (strain GDMCC 1.1324) TaxID=2138576 RepID=UPI000D3C554E|nr:methylated-DNA--[protein]-cysteine S-methyltransferase [Vitiosangium sp. GDMCC 1.1324]PTL83787.1 6-O-methylguanine DNA methyltransferase [Vitiosangium sp. GDMCC 1.1324]
MATSDYARIEQAILFLEQHAREQPRLEEVAASVGLSPYHFQRLFTRWAGISPKRFLQFQTLEFAKQLLAERRSLLEVTYETGLSSSSRLHDLFISLEAVTPGEFKLGGSGLDIHHGVHDSPFGEYLLAVCERGLCGLHFLAGESEDEALRRLQEQWPNASFTESPEVTAAWAGRIFPSRRRRTPQPLGLLVKGSNFQLKVWDALLRIPPGSVATYQDIATVIGAPGAVRAVGTAVGENPVAFLIPCHRVIRKTGAFGGYRWGAPRKRALLAWEAARFASSPEEFGRNMPSGM